MLFLRKFTDPWVLAIQFGSLEGFCDTGSVFQGKILIKFRRTRNGKLQNANSNQVVINQVA